MEAKDAIEKAIKEAREKKPGIIISRDDIYNAIFKAGIREVVECVSEFSIPAYKEGELGVKPPSDLCLNLSRWQAKLKEWGTDAPLS